MSLPATVHRYYEPVYGLNLVTLTRCDHITAMQYIKDVYKVSTDIRSSCSGHFVSLQNEKGALEYLIWYDNTNLSTLYHELIHALDDYFHYIGVPFSGEPIAYYYSYWLERILNEEKLK